MAELPDSFDEEQEDISAKQRKEIKEIRGKIQALKKSVSKGDKKKKKEVSLEIAKLETELQTKQQEKISTELPNNVDDIGNHDNEGVVSATENFESLTVQSVTGTSEEKRTGRKSRAQKQREKKQRREQERDKRIAEGEIAEDGTKRFEERSKLLSILKPLGLAIKDIRPDGNCLYAAVGDQLTTVYGKQVSVEELRSQCGDYIEGNSEQFMSFITNHETGDCCTPDYLSSYCHNIKYTSEWGGEIELVALSHVHHMPITIYQSEAPPIIIGQEDYPDQKMINVSYHQYEFSLGKHYNSIIPIIRQCD